MEKGVYDSRIEVNGGITANGDPNEMTGFMFVDFAKKIKNIDGKVLRKAVRDVRLDKHIAVFASPSRRVSFVSIETIEETNEVRGDDIKDIDEEHGLKSVPAVSVGDVNIHDAASVVANGLKEATNAPTSGSFADVTRSDCTTKKIHFRTLVNKEQLENHDTVLAEEVMVKVLCKFDNTLVGYFVGKDIAFPNVESYVTNTWRKFGFQKLTKNGSGVFLFKFANKEGMDRVLQQGPWMIRGSPIILNKWTPDLPLNKKEVNKIPVWLKLHNVPVVAYSEDGLSLIATQVGKPIMLDAYTSSMCVDSWGRISYARALVEVSANSELKKEVRMAVPLVDKTGYKTEVITVEYEWKPPHCLECKCFGHSRVQCPNLVSETNTTTNAPKVNEDSFTEVRNRKNKEKKGEQQGNSKQVAGLRLTKPKVNYYWAANKPAVNTYKPVVDRKHAKKPYNQNIASTSNSFDALHSLEKDDQDPNKDEN